MYNICRFFEWRDIMVKNAANDFYDKVKYDDNFKLEIASVEEKIRKKVLDEETAQRNLNQQR